jgi:hypothetical protein
MGAQRQGRRDAAERGCQLRDHVVPDTVVHEHSVQQNHGRTVAAYIEVINRPGRQVDHADLAAHYVLVHSGDPFFHLANQ